MDPSFFLGGQGECEWWSVFDSLAESLSAGVLLGARNKEFTSPRSCPTGALGMATEDG
jgi:hypothetical protein